MDLKLGDVQETALIPLAVRAMETENRARIQDEKAVEIINALGIDAAQYDKFFSHEGVVARTILLDRSVRSAIKKYPDAVCINLGCGLDNRFSRVDNGKVIWYDIDLPDSIMVRKKVYEERERVHMVAGSVLEEQWTADIPKDKKVIIIAEGLLMYFSKEKVTELLRIITTAFGEGVFIAELMHPMMAANSKHHDTIKDTNAVFGWGTRSGHELEEICPKLKLKQEESLNVIMKKYSIRGRLFNLLPGIRNMNDRIAVFTF